MTTTPVSTPVSSPVSIRLAQRADLATLMDLIHCKAAFDGCPDAVEATPERLAETLFGEAPLAHILLAEVAGQVVGFASYHPIYSTFLARPGLWLDDLYVRENHRGSGIGKALVERLCAIAQSIDAGRIDWTVDIDNFPAIGFYQHLGARICEQVRLCRLDRAAIRGHADQ
ncbi:MAG: GNAT family N-acetyltransferase [Synechococcales bacterium]|nr:GNAT family N-acetyltransferase [Synechococcales bacterium]